MKYVLTIIFLLCGVLRVSAQTLPTITTQPKNLALNPGDTGALTVAATSTGGVSYRWFKNGAAMADVSGITGTLTATLSFASALTTDTGNYYVVVSNSTGSVTSSTAALTVAIISAPVITSANTLSIRPDTAVNFAVTASRSPTGFAASGLPSGLSINTTTGVISGSTSALGDYTVALSAINSIGIGTQNLSISVAAELPSYANKTLISGYSYPAFNGLTNNIVTKNLSLAVKGNVYTADSARNTINKDLKEVIAGIAGQGGSTDGPAASATFLNPGGLAVDDSGNIYIADTGNHTIRKISAAGVVSTLAGAVGNAGSSDGAGINARFFSPRGMAIDGAGFIYVTDTGNHTVRKINPNGIVSTLAGFPSLSGSTDGNSAAARLNSPNGLAVDSAGNLYVSDIGNRSVRKITPGGFVSTIFNATGDLTGITINKSGSVFVWVNNYIYEIPKIGSIRKITLGAAYSVRSDGVLDYYFAPIIQEPSCLSSDDSGNIYWIRNNSGINAAYPYFPISITSSPSISDITLEKGATTQLSVIATGSPLNYFWFDTEGYAGGANGGKTKKGISNTSTAALTGTLFNGSSFYYYYENSGSFGVTVWNVGSVVTLTANLTVKIAPPTIITQPASITTVAGQPTVFSVACTSTATRPVFASAPTFSYVWKFNGTPIPDAPDLNKYTIPSTRSADVGKYSVTITETNQSYGSNSVTSATAALTVIPPVAPVITTQPQALSLKVGASGTLSVTATGAPDPTYQWKKDGVAITGATSTTYTLSSVATKDAGDYTVVVSNSAGSAISNSATLSVTSTVIPPAITTQPGSLTVISGAPASMSVVASGTAPIAYQWSLDGSTISGANSTSYTLPAAASRDAGSYTCVITNSAGSVTSTAAILTVNTAPTITAQPANQTVIAGSTTTLSVTATGNPAVTYQWRKDGVNLSGATSNALSLSNVTSANAGSYTCVITNTVGSITSNSATLTVNPSSALANLSVRTTMATGQTLIVGAVVRGGSKNVLIRAGGPALNQFGLAGMTDPNLEVYASGNALVAANNDWPATLKTTFASVGAFPFVDGSKDSALIQAFEGSFTALARGIGPGALLIEAYDTTSGTAVRLINVSARNQVGTGGDVLIAGFVINGTGTKQLLIRGVGPGLGQFGVTGFLADPKIQVYDSKNAEVASNDNWTASLATTFSSVGAFNLPANSKDAALLVTLAAGASYTVIVSGADGGTGDGIVEIYEVAP